MSGFGSPDVGKGASGGPSWCHAAPLRSGFERYLRRPITLRGEDLGLRHGPREEQRTEVQIVLEGDGGQHGWSQDVRDVLKLVCDEYGIGLKASMVFRVRG